MESEHLMKALLEQKDGLARQIYSALQATHDFISTQTRDTSSQTLGSTIFKNWFCAQPKPQLKVTGGYALLLGSSIRKNYIKRRRVA
ncbi:unnamed protein product [Brassica oleracea var. botrytis]